MVGWGLQLNLQGTWICVSNFMAIRLILAGIFHSNPKIQECLCKIFHWITKVIRIRPLGTMNISTNFDADPSNSCYNTLIRMTAVDQQTDHIVIPGAPPLLWLKIPKRAILLCRVIHSFIVGKGSSAWNDSAAAFLIADIRPGHMHLYSLTSRKEPTTYSNEVMKALLQNSEFVFFFFFSVRSV